jgi:hypothetical protein
MVFGHPGGQLLPQELLTFLTGALDHEEGKG